MTGTGQDPDTSRAAAADAHGSTGTGPRADGGTPLASARGLELRYGTITALAASDFELPRGAITAVIGPNGSGKSTLLHAMAGTAEPAGGVLEVLGVTPEKARGRVSYVLQSVNIPTGVPLTVEETVGMGRYPALGLWRRRGDADREQVEWAMELLDITALRRRHLSELSAGQRQRVYVAQGIAQDHDALLLDEPLTGLDLVSARHHRRTHPSRAQRRVRGGPDHP